MAGAVPPAQQPKPTTASLKARAITWILNRVKDVANRKINIREMQKKYHAEEGRILVMHIVDLRKRYYIRLNQGRIEYLDPVNEDDVAGGFEITSDSLISLAKGSRSRMNPATDDEYDEPYTPFDAMTHGDIRIWGDAATNDALLFAKAVQEDVYPQMRDEMKNHSGAMKK